MTTPLQDPSDNFSETHDPDLSVKRPSYGADLSAVGDLLTLKDTEAAAKAVKLFTDQLKRPDVKRELEHWRVNELRRAGFANVWLEKREGANQWKAYQAPGSEQMAPAFNKAADLCRKFTNVLYVDPPAPDPVPATGEEADVEAAEFAERVLVEVQGEGHLADLWLHREAMDLACTYDRSYIHYGVNPEGDLQPLMVLAAPTAVSVDAPFVGPDGLPVAPPYPLRYVREDGSLTDTRSEAAMQWAPRLTGEAVKPQYVRPLPASAKDVWDADGMVVFQPLPWGKVKLRYPSVAQMPEDKVRECMGYTPGSGRLWPEGTPKNTEAGALDDQLVWLCCLYHIASPLYPEGCYLEALAPDVLIQRGPWTGQRSDGSKELLDLPVSEFRQTPDGGLMTLLGPANEHRMAQWAYALQWVDDWNNRATFIPTTSNLRPEDLEERDRKYFKIAPGQAPVSEDVDPLPVTVPALIQLIGDEMNQISALTETAQGLEAPNVHSGVQARETRSAALVLMSGAQQAAERAYTRGSRIQLQFIATRFKAPQQIGWFGEDGQYRQQYWTASDLKGTRDVRLKRGSLSLQSPEAKVQEAVYYSSVGLDKATGAGVLAQAELRDILQDRLGGSLGLRDNPVRQRVKRQIAAWVDGPPEGWQAPPPSQPQIQPDPMTGGMGIVPPQPQPDPAAAGIFAPVPSDVMPECAVVRYRELMLTMAGMRYASKPLEWRLAFDMEFERMRQAAGIATVQEQQMAAQQQAQAQQQMQMAQAAAKAKQPAAKDAASSEAAPAPAVGF